MKKSQVLFLAALILACLATAAWATSFIIKVGERTAMATALATDIASGHLKIYSGTDPGVENAVTGDLLVDWTLNASNTVSNGVITLGAVTNVNASAGGTAGYFRITKSDGTAVADGDVGTSSVSLVVNTTTIANGGPCALSGTIIVPAGS
jgi:hypothetical protein